MHFVYEVLSVASGWEKCWCERLLKQCCYRFVMSAMDLERQSGIIVTPVLFSNIHSSSAYSWCTVLFNSLPKQTEVHRPEYGILS